MNEDNIHQEIRRFASNLDNRRKKTVIIKLNRQQTPKLKVQTDPKHRFNYTNSTSEPFELTDLITINKFAELLESINVVKYKKLPSAGSFIAKVNPEQLRKIIDSNLAKYVTTNKPHTVMAY